MSVTGAPTMERFRGLARSSPWRWTSLRFVLVEGDECETIRAWIHRPDLLRVESLEGRVLIPQRQRLPRLLARHPPRQSLRPRPLDPDAPRAEVGPDGLVRSRPSGFDVQYDDPMYQSYRWVAMLDPVELAEPCWREPTGEPPVTFSDFAAVEHHGRPAWQAVGVPTRSYDARCPCCPLLDSGPAAAKADESLGRVAAPTAEDGIAHLVVLDVKTGICVLTRQLGGAQNGLGHDIRIEVVDAPRPDLPFERAT